MSLQPGPPPAAGGTTAQAIAEEQRRQQAEISTQAIAAFVAAWALLDAARAAGTGLSRWFDMVDDLAELYSEAAWINAMAGYTNLRRLHFPGEPVPLPRRDRPDIDALNGSMRSLVVGPLFRRAAGSSRAVAQRDGAGAFTRHILAPARAAVQRSGDRRILGWIRVTDGNPCTWCAMLASRAVLADDGSRSLYSSREVALFTDSGERYHDHCMCTAVPIFSRYDQVPPQAAGYRRVWNDAAAGQPDPVNAFRRALEVQRRQYGSLDVAFAQGAF